MHNNSAGRVRFFATSHHNRIDVPLPIMMSCAHLALKKNTLTTKNALLSSNLGQY